MVINAYAVPGVPLKHIRLEDEKIKLKGQRILALCCQYFGTNVDTVLIKKSRGGNELKTKKYYYYLLNTELGLSGWFIIKHKLSRNTKRNITEHINDIKDKISIKDSETIKILEELKSYMK